MPLTIINHHCTPKEQQAITAAIMDRATQFDATYKDIFSNYDIEFKRANITGFASIERDLKQSVCNSFTDTTLNALKTRDANQVLVLQNAFNRDTFYEHSTPDEKASRSHLNKTTRLFTRALLTGINAYIGLSDPTEECMFLQPGQMPRPLHQDDPYYTSYLIYMQHDERVRLCFSTLSDVIETASRFLKQDPFFVKQHLIDQGILESSPHGGMSLSENCVDLSFSRNTFFKNAESIDYTNLAQVTLLSLDPGNYLHQSIRTPAGSIVIHDRANPQTQEQHFHGVHIAGDYTGNYTSSLKCILEMNRSHTGMWLSEPAR